MKQIKPRSKNQEALLQAIDNNIFTFAIGYAGSGKTLLSIYSAICLIKDKESKIRHITIIRPFVKSKLEHDFGALPGTIDDKMLPLGECVIDNLKVFMNGSELHGIISNKQIEFVPVGLLRGRSFNNEFVIVEEAQNLKTDGVYSVMSRIGENSKCVFCGDLTQSDVSQNECDLKASVELLKQPPKLKEVEVVYLYQKSDIQRNPFLYEILSRFNKLV